MRFGAVSVVVVVTVVLGLAAGRAQAAGAPDRAGAAIVVSPATGEPLLEGGRDAPFGLRLTGDPACPGDSAEGGYRVQSFMAPDDVDPATIAYDGLGPTPQGFGDRKTFLQPLYDTATNWFVAASTAKAETAGGPGPIVNVPNFSYAVFGPADLPPGGYRIGIACTLDNAPVRYWDAELKIDGARWSSPALESDARSDGLPSLALPGAGLAGLGLVGFAARRRTAASARRTP